MPRTHHHYSRDDDSAGCGSGAPTALRDRTARHSPAHCSAAYPGDLHLPALFTKTSAVLPRSSGTICPYMLYVAITSRLFHDELAYAENLRRYMANNTLARHDSRFPPLRPLCTSPGLPPNHSYRALRLRYAHVYSASSSYTPSTDRDHDACDGILSCGFMHFDGTYRAAASNIHHTTIAYAGVYHAVNAAVTAAPRAHHCPILVARMLLALLIFDIAAGVQRHTCILRHFPPADGYGYYTNTVIISYALWFLPQPSSRPSLTGYAATGPFAAS